MSSVLDYMQLCRLCLVKDKVNVPIFGESSDVGQIFFKITACLPIKVSQNDNLPKKICDTCLYKVDLLYQFWNTTVNAEKQLLQWLGEIGVEVNLKKSEQSSANHTNQHSIQDEPLVLKEERNEADAPSADAVQQPFTSSKPVAFKSYDQLTETNIKAADIREDAVEETSLSSSTNVQLKPEVSEKRLRSRTAAIKKEEIHIKTTSTNNNSSADEPMDEDSSEKLISQEESDSSMDAGERIAKEEAESEEEYEDTAESLEPTAFVGVPSDSACDTDQPGPSGLNKPVTSTDTGYQHDMKNAQFFFSPTAVKIPVTVWENNVQKDTEFTTMTIKVEPLDLDWEDDLTLLDLKNKMGLISPKKHRKKSSKSLKAARKSQKNVCVICNCTIRGRSALINHYLIHKEERIKINTETINNCDDNDFIRCSVCMKEFTLKPAFEKHAKYHVERPFFCELCNKSFKQTQNFLTHMNSHQESTEALKCNICDFSTSFKLAYDKHVKSHAREEYRCELCDKIFPARTWFIEHKNYHTGEKPFSCEECGKCFPYSRYLTAHKKSMHPHCYFKEPELNECAICKKRYSHKNSLRLHMKIHTGENTYLCDVCGKSLSSTDKLQLHKRIHTGYKPYSCTVCEKSFTKKDILTDHMRVHSGEKPFACETCGKCFSQRSPLTIHRRYHTGERPYVCHLCNKGFVSKGILGIHLKQGKH